MTFDQLKRCLEAPVRHSDSEEAEELAHSYNFEDKKELYMEVQMLGNSANPQRGRCRKETEIVGGGWRGEGEGMGAVNGEEEIHGEGVVDDKFLNTVVWKVKESDWLSFYFNDILVEMDRPRTIDHVRQISFERSDLTETVKHEIVERLLSFFSPGAHLYRNNYSFNVFEGMYISTIV